MTTRNDFTNGRGGGFPRLALAFSFTGLVFIALPLLAKSPKTTLKMATIENTGSTNTRGYGLFVYSNGQVAVGGLSRQDSSLPEPHSPRISQLVASKFFHDLAAAMPLTKLTVRHGMRSASFGTSTYVTYKGQRSPDLTFGGDAPANALKADIDAITKALHVGNMPRRPALKNPPSP